MLPKAGPAAAAATPATVMTFASREANNSKIANNSRNDSNRRDVRNSRAACNISDSEDTIAEKTGTMSRTTPTAEKTLASAMMPLEVWAPAPTVMREKKIVETEKNTFKKS
jgi:hypothetical protein